MVLYTYELLRMYKKMIQVILLMVQKSGVHQLRLVVYSIIYDGFYTIYTSPYEISRYPALGTRNF